MVFNAKLTFGNQVEKAYSHPFSLLPSLLKKVLSLIMFTKFRDFCLARMDLFVMERKKLTTRQRGTSGGHSLSLQQTLIMAVQRAGMKIM